MVFTQSLHYVSLITSTNDMMKKLSLCINNVVRMNNNNWIILNNQTFTMTSQTRLIQLNQHMVLT